MPGSPVAGIGPRAAPDTVPAASWVVRGSLMTTLSVSAAGAAPDPAQWMETRANSFHVEVTFQERFIEVNSRNERPSARASPGAPRRHRAVLPSAGAAAIRTPS